MTGPDLLINVLLLALAAGAVVDVWLNGSIFATWRARAETWENTFSELLGCSLCLNYQVPIWLTLGFWVLPAYVPALVAVILRAVLIALAVGRLAWLLNYMCLGAEHGYDRGSHELGSPVPEEDH
jgi:hypothetical protein